MTPLGKCMVFYFKYQPEMIRLYWKDEKPSGLDDPEIPKMVSAVGAKCCEEVGEFLAECGKIIYKRCDAAGRCLQDKLSDTKWTVSYGVWLKSGSKPHAKNWRMMAGVDIPRTKAEIIPWVWGRGKLEAEEKMIHEFGEQAKRSSEVDLPAGRVALAQIPILSDGIEGFNIDQDALLKQVDQAFAAISQRSLENVYNFVKNLKA